MVLETSDVISIFAFIFTVIAVVVAAAAAGQAKKANNLTLLKPRKEVYDAFVKLKAHMTQHAQYADIHEIDKFNKFSNDAVLYFPDEIVKQVSKYHSLCKRIVIESERNPGDSEAVEELLEAEEKLAKDIVFKIENLIGNLARA